MKYGGQFILAYTTFYLRSLICYALNIRYCSGMHADVLSGDFGDRRSTVVTRRTAGQQENNGIDVCYLRQSGGTMCLNLCFFLNR